MDLLQILEATTGCLATFLNTTLPTLSANPSGGALLIGIVVAFTGLVLASTQFMRVVRGDVK